MITTFAYKKYRSKSSKEHGFNMFVVKTRYKYFQSLFSVKGREKCTI